MAPPPAAAVTPISRRPNGELHGGTSEALGAVHLLLGAALSITSSPPSRLASPPDSPFYQQRLKAWQPILTPGWVILVFILIGAPFVGIGIWLMDADSKVRGAA